MAFTPRAHVLFTVRASKRNNDQSATNSVVDCVIDPYYPPHAVFVAAAAAAAALDLSSFALGYGGMRTLGFTEQEARTASIEVGMQNSALAVVLAQRGLSDPLSAVPGAVSATCHSLIGSALAAYWRTGDRGLGRGVGGDAPGGSDGSGGSGSGNSSISDGGAVLKS